MAVIPGLGTLLQHGVFGTPITYTTIAQRVEIKGPGLEWGEADTTTLDSTLKTSRPTIVDAGMIELTIQYDPTAVTHKLLTAMISSAPSATVAADYWQLKFADVAVTPLPFTGFLKKFEVGGVTAEGNVTADIAIKINTMPAFPT